MKTLTGVIHGNVIHLHTPPQFAEGSEVEVVIRSSRPHRIPGEGFLNTEGALADDLDWDEIMDEVQRSRRVERQAAGEVT